MVFKLLNHQLIVETYSNNTIKTFKGLRVLAVDGSTVRLPISKELYEAYGSSEINNSIPLARISMIFDVLNGLTLHASINTYKSSERPLAIDHINELCEQDKNLSEKTFDGDMIMFDRGYPSVGLLFFLQSKKKHFLIRMQGNCLDEIKTIIKDGLDDSIITVSAFKKTRRKTAIFDQYLPDLDKDATMQIRILVFKLKSGQTEVIATSLLDQEKFSYNEIFELYGLRWNIEECYKFYKSIAEIENFSGKSKLAIEQDFLATIFTCNISSLLMQEAQDELDQANAKANESGQSTSKTNIKYEYKVNRNTLIGIVKNEIINVFLSNQDLDEYCDMLKARIKKNLVPIRPNRTYPRRLRMVQYTVARRAL